MAIEADAPNKDEANDQRPLEVMADGAIPRDTVAQSWWRCRKPSCEADKGRSDDVGVILLVLLLVLIFGAAGFALHVLWILAAVLLVLWLLGFLVSGAEHSWYRVQRK
jgi:hypothetical protein